MANQELLQNIGQSLANGNIKPKVKIKVKVQIPTGRKLSLGRLGGRKTGR